MPKSNIVNARGAGLSAGGSASPSVRNMQDYNGFDRSQTFFQTQRFGEISPIFAKKFISGDRIPLQSKHYLKSHTLASPLMSNVYMNRAFYNVPLQCIYHNTFEYWFKNPVRGEDIPENVKSGFDMSFIRGRSNSIYSFLYNNISLVQKNVSDNGSLQYVNTLFLFMQIASRDGLLSKLGYGFSFDAADRLYDIFFDLFGDINHTLTIGFLDEEGNDASINFRTKILTRNSNSFLISLSEFRRYFYDIVNNKYPITSFTSDIFDISSDVTLKELYLSILESIPVFEQGEYINLEKLFAYQYVCSQFYTNSFVDDIYSARSWEENNLSLLSDAIRSASNNATIRSYNVTFSYQGKQIAYDLISRRIIGILCQFSYSNTSPLPEFRTTCVRILRNIFEVHYSLRGSDFFTDSRTQPLAIGDVYSQVSAQGVSAIDVNKSLWIQRLLNAVNRIPQHIETYLKEMFGFEPQSREPKPMYISKERFLIIGQEIENTSNSEQGKIVTNLVSSDNGRYRFETFASEPCIVIGLVSYSLDYAYSQAVDKEFFEFDRLDNFNPYFQHVGDQPLMTRELINDPSKFGNSEIFAYQLRYYQYKKSINHASGGFLDYLPSWIALFDKSNAANQRHLNSVFIRNSNEDFDAFYSSLYGFNPCQYFHFIVRFDTQCHVTSKQQKYPSLV